MSELNHSLGLSVRPFFPDKEFYLSRWIYGNDRLSGYWLEADNVINRSLHWGHNERGGVSNHRCLTCLLNCWFRRRSKKISKLRVTGLCAGIHRWPVVSPHKKISNTENVSIWWRHDIIRYKRIKFHWIILIHEKENNHHNNSFSMTHKELHRHFTRVPSIVNSGTCTLCLTCLITRLIRCKFYIHAGFCQSSPEGIFVFR